MFNATASSWFQQRLKRADTLKDTIGVVLVVNVKGRTVPINDYATDSIVTEFLSNRELDDFVQAFEDAGIYCEVVFDEDGFVTWLDKGRKHFCRPQPIVYNVSQNGTGPARFALVPDLCRLHRLPLVDSDAYVAALGQHKYHSISLLEHFGLPVARTWWYTKRGWWPHMPPSHIKLIAKPTLESASVGIRKENISNVNDGFEKQLKTMLECFRQPIVVQEFISGFEVEVPVVEASQPEPCMAVGIEFRGQRNMGEQIMCYDDVFSDSYAFYDFSNESAEATARIMDISRKAYLGLGFAGPARIDFRVSESGEPKIMEVTCKPHLTMHTSFTYAIREMGYAYADLLRYVVGSACERHGIFPTIQAPRTEYH